MTVTATYSDNSTADVTSSCSINPPENTEFDSDTAVEILFREGQDEQFATLQLTHLYLIALNITQQPEKTMYKTDETISYDGLVVRASYSDGSSRDVTAFCSISPAEGKAFNPDTDSLVEISYQNVETAETSFSITHNAVTSLSISSQPAKTWYHNEENIDYTGLVVTATYSDESTVDVTNLCSITPQAGKAFDPDTDTNAEITFADNSSAILQLNHLYLTSLSVTSNPEKTSYKYGETIDYTGLVVTASYSDSSTDDVTESCSITPAEGKAFDPHTDTNPEISYTEDSVTETASFMLTEIYLTGIQVTTNPNKTAYRNDEAISYEGIVVRASYSDNSTDDVTDKCIFSPAEGKSFNSETDTTVTISYTEGQMQQSCTLLLTEAEDANMTLRIDTLPTQTVYVQGKPVNYSGAVIKAVLSDGNEHNVTDFCSYTPSVKGELTTVTVSCALPAEPYVFDQNSGYVVNGSWRYELPTNTYIDIYQVTAGHKYLLTLGNSVGSRFRAMFTTEDVSIATANVTGTNIINSDNPAAYASVEYTAPSNGYIVVGKDNVGQSGVKTYLYDAQASVKPITETFSLTTVESEYSLSVQSMPYKTGYKRGDNIDLRGLKMKVTHVGGDEHIVTDYCSFSPANEAVINDAVIVTATCATPEDPYSFDRMYGDSKTDGYRVTAGHRYFIALGRNVGNIFRVVFCVNENRGTEYIIKNSSNPTAYASVEYLASSNGYIFIDKDNSGKSGIKTYLYDAQASVKSLSTAFQLTVGELEAISVCLPAKSRYRVGENFDYTGAIVTAVYTDGHLENVTESAAFNPANGTVATSNDPTNLITKTVQVSFEDKNSSFDLTIGGVAIMSLSVTPPDKTFYYSSDTLDYTGCSVTAVYWDGRTKDVTNEVTFEPWEGRYPYPYTEENYYVFDPPELRTREIKSNTQVVTITYEELDEQACSNFETYIYSSDEWRSGYGYYWAKTDENGDIIFDTPDHQDENGQWHYGTTTYYTRVRYLDLSDGLIKTQTFSLEGMSVPIDEGGGDGTISLVSGGSGEGGDLYTISIPSHNVGGIVERNGQLCWHIIHRNDFYDVIPAWNYIYFTYAKYVGESFIPFLTVYYQSKATYDLNLSVFGLDRLVITKMPDKTMYHLSDSLDTTGMEVSVYYTDGNPKDVSSSVTIQYPFNEWEKGTLLSTCARFYDAENRCYNVPIEYSERVSPGKDTITCDLPAYIITISELVIAPPQKTSYRCGEALDYTGVSVTAVYTDGSTINVTSSAVFSPANGSLVTEDTNHTVSVSYSHWWDEFAPGGFSASGSFSLNIVTE